jgi:hypothetical protein
MTDKLLIILAIELAVIFDAIRDGLLASDVDRALSNALDYPSFVYTYRKFMIRLKFDRWHIVKWIAFYTPLITLLYLGRFVWWEIAILALTNFALWRKAYNLTIGN